jgi:cytochrome c-type biogenesis protein CcmF
MIPEIGHFALVLALLVGIAQASVPLMGARRNDPRLMGVAESTALAQFGFVAAAFAALTACYVRSDFSVLTVFENSHSAMPLIYKFTSVWGNHEGSMLLWVLILTLFGALVAAFGRNMPRRAGLDRGRVLFVHPADLEPLSAACARAVRRP